MKRISRHKILLAGDSFAHCSVQVNKFFDLTSLVIYDCIEISEQESISGLDADFLNQIRLAEERNRQQVDELLHELQLAGVKSVKDLHQLAQGYESKLLHILSHFLDGFVGIDSYFYNLLDDSHWLPEPTAEAIEANPSQYWLLHLNCFSIDPDEAGILRL